MGATGRLAGRADRWEPALPPAAGGSPALDRYTFVRPSAAVARRSARPAQPGPRPVRTPALRRTRAAGAGEPAGREARPDHPRRRHGSAGRRGDPAAGRRGVGRCPPYRVGCPLLPACARPRRGLRRTVDGQEANAPRPNRRRARLGAGVRLGLGLGLGRHARRDHCRTLESRRWRFGRIVALVPPSIPRGPGRLRVRGSCAVCWASRSMCRRPRPTKGGAGRAGHRSGGGSVRRGLCCGVHRGRRRGRRPRRVRRSA